MGKTFVPMNSDYTFDESASLYELSSLADRLSSWWFTARAKEETRLLGIHVPPPDPGPQRKINRRELTDEDREYLNRITLLMEFHTKILWEAEEVPEVKAIQNDRQKVIDVIWARIDNIKEPRLKAEPGLQRCSACGSDTISVPLGGKPRPHYGVCKNNDSHLTPWLPWGG